MRTKFIDNTKIMLNGQITLPKEIREVLGVSGGDRVFRRLRYEGISKTNARTNRIRTA